jgi:hypothetical protein
VADVPFVGYTNDTLAALADVRAGDMVDCPHCPYRHPTSGTGDILFFACPTTGRTYLAGVGGKNVIGVEPDASSDGPSPMMVCDECWTNAYPHREPTRVLDAQPDSCAGCGQETRSGIFLMPKAVAKLWPMRT